MTIYGLLSSFSEFNVGKRAKVYNSNPSSETGFYAIVMEENENPNVSIYGRGGINSKIIDVEFRQKSEKSNEAPVDNSPFWKLLKEKVEPGIETITQDTSGKNLVECFIISYPTPRYDASSKTFVAYMRLRMLLDTLS